MVRGSSSTYWQDITPQKNRTFSNTAVKAELQISGMPRKYVEQTTIRFIPDSLPFIFDLCVVLSLDTLHWSILRARKNNSKYITFTNRKCMYLRTYVVCMYVFMYVCVYVCMYVVTYVRTYLRMYVCMYVCMHVCTYVRTYICMYVCMYYVCMYLFMYLWMYVRVCVYERVYVCMYVFMYVCMYLRMYVCMLHLCYV